MNRAVLTKSKIIGIAVFLAIAAAGAGTYVIHARTSVQTVANSQHQLTQISYHGRDNIDALTLLKRNATVEAKHYSFGDLVTTINGSAGSGPKYWTFYINGKEASVGAGVYKTKDSDTLMWKLQ